MTKIEVVETVKTDLSLEELNKVSQQYLIFQKNSTEIIEKQMELIAIMADQIEKSALLFYNEINKLTNRIEDLEQVIFNENNRNMH